MAVATPIKIPGVTIEGIQVFEWTLTSADPIGEAIAFPPYADRSVQVVGDTWGGATCTVEGSLFSPTDNKFQPCTNQGAVPIAISTNDDLSVVAEATLYMRPNLTAVGVNAVVRVRILCRG